MNVVIYHNDEIGEELYSVCDAENQEFWIESFKTLDRCLLYCDMTGYDVVQKICGISDCDCDIRMEEMNGN